MIFNGGPEPDQRIYPKLGKIVCLLRPLLSKKINWKWEEEHENASQRRKREIQKTTMMKHFEKNQPVQILCDASREGLRAVLQQRSEQGWVAKHFASLFLTTFEQKYSNNEQELLAVVLAIENFRNYVY